jgi:hypothetical protein
VTTNSINIVTSANYRRVFMVISPVSLGYARFSLESLFRNSADPLHLHLITDSDSDRERLIEELNDISRHQDTSAHRWSVFSEDDLADREANIFGPYPNLRLFRHGHPCWRKITDPVLLSQAPEDLDGEMVLLDPDLYFPNRFRFEPTPQTGVLLMWQKPSCLVPPKTVRFGMEQGIRFAHHVDIGVGGWRAPVDLDWLEWLLGRLDVRNLPRVMHIEAIVWAAMAMRIGGGYLDPNLWHCWYRNQPKRILRKMGLPGIHLLKVENFASIKCFHAGGEAKWWLAEARKRGMLDQDRDLTSPGPIIPFEELMPTTYYREQRVKSVLASLGYYSVFRT